MANIQYIGARYVPKFYENPDDSTNNWKSGVSYEPLTVVTYLDDSYTSKIAVPASVGNPTDNPTYWVKTGNYNAALALIGNRVSETENDIAAIKNAYINALTIGFKNDGNTDNAAIFNSVFNSDNYDGKTIYFPAGLYLINSTVNITKLVKMVGDPNTHFKAGATFNTLFKYDFSSRTYLARRSGVLIDGITIDGNYTVDCAITLFDYIDFGINNVDVSNFNICGIDTRPEGYENINTGCQLICNNVRFWNYDYDNSSIAIKDQTADSLYNDIIVVGYKIAFAGNAMITNLHHWLVSENNFQGSITLYVKGGSYTNIYADTCEAAVKPSLGYADHLIKIENLQIHNNTDVNPTYDSYVVDMTTRDDANIIINNVDISTNKFYILRGTNIQPSSLKIKNVHVLTNSDTWRCNYIDGEINTGNNVGFYRGLANNTRSINDLYRAGVHIFDSGHLFADMPFQGSSGIVIVIPRGNQDVVQIVIYSQGIHKIYYRFLYQGAGNWIEFTGTVI